MLYRCINVFCLGMWLLRSHIPVPVPVPVLVPVPTIPGFPASQIHLLTLNSLINFYLTRKHKYFLFQINESFHMYNDVSEFTFSSAIRGFHVYRRIWRCNKSSITLSLAN